MPLNSLPASIAAAIQTGYLERRFQRALRAKLGFRAIADREPFGAGIGETITKTRTGLLPAVTTPIAPASTGDFTGGLTAQNYPIEQYTLGVAQYPGTMQLNVATARVAIDDLFLNNAYTLGEQAARSVDTIAQHALFDQYVGGNTRVRTTLGAPATTLTVDDVRGFFLTTNAASGTQVSVSASFPVSVMVGADLYTLTGVQADGVSPATQSPWLAALSFSGAGSNVSTTPGGYSGVLTFSTNVSVSDGTAGNSVVSALAPTVVRPSLVSTGVQAGNTSQISSTNDANSAKLTIAMILNAKATLSANGVMPVSDRGNYVFYADPLQMTGLYQDPAFQFFFRGQDQSAEYRRGLVADLLGVSIVETNLNPVQNLANVGIVRRGILCGQGALVEAEFTSNAYVDAQKADADMITVVDGIAHVTREALDPLKQVLTQSWTYIGGFVAPTDVTTTPLTVPTASNSSLKRAIVVESL